MTGQYPYYPYGPEENLQHLQGGGPIPSQSQKLDVGTAFRFGIQQLKFNKKFWIGSTAGYVVIVTILTIALVVWLLNYMFQSDGSIRDFPASILVGVIIGAALIFIPIDAWFTYASILESRGIKATFGEVFRMPTFAITCVVAAFKSLISALFSITTQLPQYPLTAQLDANSIDNGEFGSYVIFGIFVPILVSLLLFLLTPFIMFWAYYAADGKGGVGYCITEGIKAGKRHYSSLIIYTLLSALASALIGFTLGLATIVILPVLLISQAHLYQQNINLNT